ncbi:MAG TPA: iron ABC transporter permease [Flavobacteriales bacterium]|nr:iron ABC transporter permease [Flavobacteriales bacterium]
MRSKSLFALISALAVLLAAPLLVVITAPLHAPAPEWHHVLATLLPGHLWETVQLIAGVIIVSVVLAVPSAWLIATHEFPLRSFFRWALVLPLAMPTYISAFAYAALLGPTGTLSAWLNDTVGIKPDIVSLPGLCMVLAFVLFPYILLPARAAFVQGMTSQLEAGRLLGASPTRRFRALAVPLARPAIVGGALLVAMEALNDFGAVKYYGIRTLTTGIFRAWGGLYDLGSALRLSAVLVGLVALLLWIEHRSRKGRSQATDQVPVARSRLGGPWAWLATAWCLLIVVLGVGLPLGKVSGDVLSMGTDAWPEGTFSAFGNTLGIAVLAAGCTLVVAVLFAFRERHANRWAIVQRIADLGYAIPGAVIAIGVMALAGSIDRNAGLSFALIGSIGLLTYAFVVRFLAVGTQPLYGNLRQQSTALDASARMLGASPWRAFTHINLPLLRPALAASALLVAIDVIKELPLTLILRPFNMHTLSTKTYELASIEQLREASAPALLIVVCGLVPVFLLERMVERMR